MSFPSNKHLTLAEVLQNLDFFFKNHEKGSMKSETTIFVTLPQEADNNLSEEDSTEEDLVNLISTILGENYCAEAGAY